MTAQAPTFARPEVIAALGDHLVAVDRSELEGLADPTVGEDQAGMVRDLTLSGDGVRLVVGKAGEPGGRGVRAAQRTRS